MLVWSLSNKWVLFWALGASADTFISIKALGDPGGTNPTLGDLALCFFFKLSVLTPQPNHTLVSFFAFCFTFSLLKYWPFFSLMHLRSELLSRQELLLAVPGLHLSFVMGQIQHTNKDKMIFHFTLWSEEIQLYVGRGYSDSFCFVMFFVVTALSVTLWDAYV